MSTPAAAFAEMVDQMVEPEPDGGFGPEHVKDVSPADCRIIIQAHARDILDDFEGPHYTAMCLEYLARNDYTGLGYFVASYLERKARQYLLDALRDEAGRRDDVAAGYGVNEDTAYDEQRQTALDRETVTP